MKISSASKKVLASALSAAMVVAFAPTVAFGAAPTKVATNTYYNAFTGATGTVEYYDADLAFAAAVNPSAITVSNGSSVSSAGYMEDKAIVTLDEDATLLKDITPKGGATKVTVALNGKKLISNAKKAGVLSSGEITVIGEGTVGAIEEGAKTAEYKKLNVGTTDDAANVTIDGGKYSELIVAEGSTIAITSGIFVASSGNANVLEDALRAAQNAGATVEVSSDGTVSNPYEAWTAGSLTNNYYYKVSSTVATVTTSAGAVSNASDLQAAVTASQAGDTITLLKDVDFYDKAATVPASVDLTIDLNGHTIDRGTINTKNSSASLTLKGEGKLTGVTTTGNITIDEGASVTVANSAARKVLNDKVDKPSVLSDGKITVKGNLTVENTAPNSAVELEAKAGSVVEILKGTFANLFVDTDATANIKGGLFNSAGSGQNSAIVTSSGAYLTVSKAEYAGRTAGATTDELTKKQVAEGSVIDVKSSGLFEVGAPVATAKKTEYAADKVTKYTKDVQCASLQGAVNNATEKTTVTLTADVEESVTVAKELDIDLGGKTVKGTITANGSGKKISIDNGNVVAIANNGYALVVTAGIVTVKGGTFSAEQTTDPATGTVRKPAGLVNSVATASANDSLTIAGGTFKGNYTVNAKAWNGTDSVNGISGGTFDKKPTTVAAKCSATQNADGTWTVALGEAKKANFSAVNGVAKTDDVNVTVADKDKALEAAVDAAYSKVLTAAWAADPKATSLAGFEFRVVNETTGETKKVSDLTGITTLDFGLVVRNYDPSKQTIKADADYAFGANTTHSVDVAVYSGGVAPANIVGYLTGIAIDVNYKNAQIDGYTYKVVGGENATYDAEKKTYTFSAKTGSQYGVESISNTILELQEQMKQIEVAAQDKAAANTIKGTAKTIKTKKGVTAKKFTVKLKAVTSESGAKATFKKANTAGKSKITVSKSGTITIKKGLKKGTYKVKVKGTVGVAAPKTIYAKIVIK